ncbi:MAG TPA: L-ribulose-5-phosphate 4-epimerase AraD [Candidatus Acidoferrum sp.]|nr:L-ribulose-5-phosphate 4-epimerase AraD [Candidatus Acidoferrum sp.]
MLQPNLREQVLEANLELVRRGLVLSTFGNASGVARDKGLIVIKPSGVPYDEMKPEHLVVTDMHGNVVEGTLRPSSDLPTHAALYRAFPSLGGIAHTHSEYATAWAQARKPIPCFGTTHADYFHGPIPLTEVMSDEEIKGEYEANTGVAIIRTFEKVDPMSIPAVLVANHGPFAWGVDPQKAAETAWMLEAVARVAYFTVGIDANAQGIGKALHDRHFLRKHGKQAYYGQVRTKE